MDKETREFLTKQFEIIDSRFDKIDARFNKIDEKFDKVDRRFNEIDAKFDKIDGRFEKVDGQFEAVDAKFDSIQHQIDAKAAENRRHVEVVAEGLRNDIQQITEGHKILLEGQTRILECIDQLKRELGGLINFPYADPNHRMRTLE